MVLGQGVEKISWDLELEGQVCSVCIYIYIFIYLYINRYIKI